MENLFLSLQGMRRGRKMRKKKNLATIYIKSLFYSGKKKNANNEGRSKKKCGKNT